MSTFINVFRSLRTKAWKALADATQGGRMPDAICHMSRLLEGRPRALPDGEILRPEGTELYSEQ